MKAARVLAMSALLAGCQGMQLPPEEEPCSGAECGASSRAELIGAIDGFSDPFSEFLRAEASEDGTLGGDYKTVLDGVGGPLGCDSSTERSFVVLSNFGMLPKIVFTRCSDEPTEASRFFMAAPAAVAGPDMNPQLLHMAAWDADAGVYRRFATSVDESGSMRVSVEPPRCMGCHGGPEVLKTWQPLMNEMTNPWTQWNAEPGFASHFFDEDLDADIAAGENYRDMLSDVRLGSASDLEPLVRAGIDRVTSARVESRHAAADLEESLSLIRPLFCDETVNYTSEIHRSGELRSAAVVDDSLRNLLASLRPDGWPFVREDRFRLALPSAQEETVILMPVRGESTAAVERALLARRILSPIDVLRIRAIDYGRPQGSHARCSIFRAGSELLRARGSELVARLEAGATNGDLVPVLHAELMTALGLETGDESIAAIANTEDPEYKAALQSGDFSAFIISIDELGDRLQAAIDGTTREALLETRDERACDADHVFPTAPLLPGLDCP